MPQDSVPGRSVQVFGPRKAADEKFCFSCGTVMHNTAMACPVCGARQPDQTGVVENAHSPPRNSLRGQEAGLLPDHVFCRGCGKPLHASAPFCPGCGAPQRASIHPAEGEKSKIAAALFAFFLGGLGGHKFYLGQIGLGVLYLLFCWTFIPAIVGFIEGICYLSMSDEAFARRYG